MYAYSMYGFGDFIFLTIRAYYFSGVDVIEGINPPI